MRTGLLVVLLVAGCSDPPPPEPTPPPAPPEDTFAVSSTVRERLGDEAVALFEHADAMRIFAIGASSEERAPLTAEETARVREALYQSIDYAPIPMACFRAQHGLEVQRGAQTIVIEISFGCGHVRVGENGGAIAKDPLRAVLAPLFEAKLGQRFEVPEGEMFGRWTPIAR